MYMKRIIQKPRPLPPILLQKPTRMAVAPLTLPTTIIMTVMTIMTMPTLPESDVSTARSATVGVTTTHTTPICTGMTAILATGV